MENKNPVVQILKMCGLEESDFSPSHLKDICHLKEVEVLKRLGFVVAPAADDSVSYFLITRDGKSMFISSQERLITDTVVSRHVLTTYLDKETFGNCIAKVIIRKRMKQFKSCI